jgi:hypothetical protein
MGYEQVYDQGAGNADSEPQQVYYREQLLTLEIPYKKENVVLDHKRRVSAT